MDCNTTEAKTASRVSFEEFEKHRDERILDARMRHFFESWQPADPYEASRFSADLFMLVRTIYGDASKNSETVMMQLAKNMPPMQWVKQP